MKQTRPSASHTTEKKSQQDQILDRLFDYFSKPKGEKPSSDNEINVSFYRSALHDLPLNYYGNNYSGVNIVMLLMAQEESATKVPIYATFKQAASLLEQYKDQLPPKSEIFDPDKPLKGLKLDAQVVKYLETYKKDGEEISKAKFENETQGMSFKEMHDKGYLKRKGLKPYKVFPIERIKHLLPQSFIDERPYFAKQEELENQEMSEEMKDERFVEKALTIIEAMGVPVMEKNQDRAYYSPNEHIIVLPLRKKCSSDKAFLALALHELSHSTSKALGRNMSNAFGTAGYAKEEIISETATMFMCLNEGLETFSSHCRYIEGWASHFTDKKKVLLSVCKQAKEAQQYISDKVAEHQLKLANQPTYTAPNQLEQHADFNPKYRQELRAFLNAQADIYGTMIPLRNQEVVGFNRISKGIEVFTEEKSVKIYGTTAQNLEKKLSELDVKQSLFNDIELDCEPTPLQTSKPRASNRLSM
ncbi:zincin-like metallopeptidase domain-containing protein [Vibrio aestuarianus]|uniref:zincin-like metallopeptidase domain-containing protein n=1 Tax=Vibrio aestuarianus TaxID=28171 RepID=UPI00249B0557|nr:zincin-like metallopeptidase domain-containing protein [Vibrio aestuarianus]WDS54558.1 zincin-like metallopeptidase domain-containing protein [Vibrio aestuarianus]